MDYCIGSVRWERMTFRKGTAREKTLLQKGLPPGPPFRKLLNGCGVAARQRQACHPHTTEKSYLGVFAGEGAGPLGVGPKMRLDASRFQLTPPLRKCIASRALAPSCKKRVPPHFPLRSDGRVSQDLFFQFANLDDELKHFSQFFFAYGFQLLSSFFRPVFHLPLPPLISCL